MKWFLSLCLDTFRPSTTNKSSWFSKNLLCEMYTVIMKSQRARNSHYGQSTIGHPQSTCISVLNRIIYFTGKCNFHTFNWGFQLLQHLPVVRVIHFTDSIWLISWPSLDYIKLFFVPIRCMPCDCSRHEWNRYAQKHRVSQIKKPRCRAHRFKYTLETCIGYLLSCFSQSRQKIKIIYFNSVK